MIDVSAPRIQLIVKDVRVWDTRYGPAVLAARRERLTAVTQAALRLVAVLTANAVPAEGDYTRVGEVMGLLAQEQAALQKAISTCPVPMAYTADGTLDPFARPLAGLVGRLAAVLVTYHGLYSIPDALRAALAEDLDALRLDAHALVAAAKDADRDLSAASVSPVADDSEDRR